MLSISSQSLPLPVCCMIIITNKQGQLTVLCNTAEEMVAEYEPFEDGGEDDVTLPLWENTEDSHWDIISENSFKRRDNVNRGLQTINLIPILVGILSIAFMVGNNQCPIYTHNLDV